MSKRSLPSVSIVDFRLVHWIDTAVSGRLRLLDPKVRHTLEEYFFSMCKYQQSIVTAVFAQTTFLLSYPMTPPVVRFLTKILHPNVSRHGDVGLDSIHHNWSLALTISKV